MEVRIYYEDTDAAGVVYHANYLKYLERARTEYFRDLGYSVADLAAEGFIFPVVRMEIDFKVPARHDDLLIIDTSPVRVSGATFTVFQKVVRKADDKLLAEGLVTLACINPALKAHRIPINIRRLLESGIAAH